jgi:hypothetical protein
MKKISVLGLLAMAVFFMKPTPGESCSCAWKGPFMIVAREAPLVIRGKILRQHPGPEPAMDVLVLETLAGGILDSGLVVQMGDGKYCRPPLDGFPPGSEWILALNGPGAKPGSGLALSHCGEFWLRVDHGAVVGSIDGDQRQRKRMPLSEFRNRFRYPRFNEKFSGSIQAGLSRNQERLRAGTWATGPWTAGNVPMKPKQDRKIPENSFFPRKWEKPSTGSGPSLTAHFHIFKIRSQSLFIDWRAPRRLLAAERAPGYKCRNIPAIPAATS